MVNGNSKNGFSSHFFLLDLLLFTILKRYFSVDHELTAFLMGDNGYIIVH